MNDMKKPLFFGLTLGIAIMFLVSGCLAEQKSALSFEQDCRGHTSDTKHVRWFLDPSLIYSSIVVRNSTDTNAYVVAFSYNMSIGAPCAHWIVYKPQEIVIMIEMSLNSFDTLPEGKMGGRTFLVIPNSLNRRIVFSDTLTNKHVATDFRYTENDLPKDLECNTQQPSNDDPFHGHSGNDSFDPAKDLWSTN